MSENNLSVEAEDIIRLIDNVGSFIDKLIFEDPMDPNYGLLVNSGYSSSLFSDGFYRSIYSKYYAGNGHDHDSQGSDGREVQKIWKFIIWLYSINKLFFIDIYDDVLRFLSEDTASAYNPLLGFYRDHVEHSLDTALIVKQFIDDIPKGGPTIDLGEYQGCWDCIKKLSNYDNYEKTKEYKIFKDWLESIQTNIFRLLRFREDYNFDETSIWNFFMKYVAFTSALVHDIGYSFTRNLNDILGLLKFRVAFRGSILEWYWGTDSILNAMINTVAYGLKIGLLSGKTTIGLVHPVFSAYILLRRLVKEGNLWAIRNLLSLIILRHSWEKSIKDHGKKGKKNVTLNYKRQCKKSSRSCWPFSCLLYVADEISRNYTIGLKFSDKIGSVNSPLM